MIKVDAMGQACPLPVVMANKALKERKDGESVEVHVDNEIAVQNLRRMASKQNLDCSVVADGNAHFVLTLTGAGSAAAAEAPVICAPQAADNVVVAVSSKTMGSGSEELGALLMKGFLYALTQQEQLPKTVLFYNGGAHIPTEGGVSVEDLKNLESRGVEILTCGTCLDFYGLKDKLAVGGVTNMYSIVEILSKASHVIKP